MQSLRGPRVIGHRFIATAKERSRKDFGDTRCSASSGWSWTVLRTAARHGHLIKRRGKRCAGRILDRDGSVRLALLCLLLPASYYWLGFELREVTLNTSAPSREPVRQLRELLQCFTTWCGSTMLPQDITGIQKCTGPNEASPQGDSAEAGGKPDSDLARTHITALVEDLVRRRRPTPQRPRRLLNDASPRDDRKTAVAGTQRNRSLILICLAVAGWSFDSAWARRWLRSGSGTRLVGRHHRTEHRRLLFGHRPYRLYVPWLIRAGESVARSWACSIRADGRWFSLGRTPLGSSHFGS